MRTRELIQALTERLAHRECFSKVGRSAWSSERDGGGGGPYRHTAPPPAAPPPPPPPLPSHSTLLEGSSEVALGSDARGSAAWLQWGVRVAGTRGQPEPRPQGCGGQTRPSGRVSPARADPGQASQRTRRLRGDFLSARAPPETCSLVRKWVTVTSGSRAFGKETPGVGRGELSVPAPGTGA